MTIVVIGHDEEVEQAGKQLYKLMEVLKVTDVTPLNCVAHELALIKVAAKSQTRSEILQIAQIYDARVVDASPTTLLIEATGPEDPDRRVAEHAESVRHPRAGANRAGGDDARLDDGRGQGQRSRGAGTGGSRERRVAARELSQERRSRRRSAFFEADGSPGGGSGDKPSSARRW